jgi:hypothetical protein
VLHVLQVELAGSTPLDARVMAIGLHNIDCTLRRSHSPSMFGIKQLPLLFRMATTTDASVGVTTWSITAPFPVRRRTDAIAAHDQCTCGLALAGDTTVYNEEAFRYLLDIERKRFDASAQPFVLVLVDVTRRAGHADRMSAAIAGEIFASLTSTLRDTDVIGWYREDRIIGAVLTHLGDAPLADATPQMRARLTRALGSHLSADVARHLKVRLYRPRVGVARLES